MDFYFRYDMREFTRIPYIPVETGNLKWEFFYEACAVAIDRPGA